MLLELSEPEAALAKAQTLGASGELSLEVEPFMPSMGHGQGSKTKVEDQGNGKYKISKIYFLMGGHWELRLVMKQGEKVLDKQAIDVSL